MAIMSLATALCTCLYNAICMLACNPASPVPFVTAYSSTEAASDLCNGNECIEPVAIACLEGFKQHRRKLASSSAKFVAWAFA